MFECLLVLFIPSCENFFMGGDGAAHGIFVDVDVGWLAFVYSLEEGVGKERGRERLCDGRGKKG